MVKAFDNENHAQQREWERDDEAKFGPLVTGSHLWWGLLARVHPGEHVENYERSFPGDDHVEYRCKGDEITRLSHPYDLQWDELGELVDACRVHGIIVGIDTHSRYFPGQTMRVIMKKARSSPLSPARDTA